MDERDDDVVPPLLLDEEPLVTVPDERLVLLPLLWRKLPLLLLDVLPTLLLLLLPVDVEPFTRVDVPPCRKLLLLPLLLPDIVDTELFTRVVLLIFVEPIFVLTFTSDARYELPLFTPVDTVLRLFSRVPLATLP